MLTCLDHRCWAFPPLSPLPRYQQCSMAWNGSDYARWLVILMAVVVTIAVDTAVIVLSVLTPSSSTSIISDSLITLVSLFLQVICISTIQPVRNRSFPYIKQVLACVFVVVVCLSIVFETLFALGHNCIFSHLTQLTCLFHAMLVEVHLCS